MPKPRKRPMLSVTPAERVGLESEIDRMGGYLQELKNGSTTPEEAAIRVIKKGRFHITSQSYWRIVYELITEVIPQCNWHGQTVMFDVGPGDVAVVNNAEDFARDYLEPILGKAFDVAKFITEYKCAAVEGVRQLQQIATTQAELRQQNAISSGEKADPTKEDGRKTKKGEVRNPSGANQHGKSGAEDYCYHGNNNPGRTYPPRGNSPEYLAQQVAKASPEVHSRMKAGEFPSVRAAAIAAGVLTPRIRVEWKANASADAIASAILKKIPPDMLPDVIQSLTNRIQTND